MRSKIFGGLDQIIVRCTEIVSPALSEIFGGPDQPNQYFTFQLKLFRPCAAKNSVFNLRFVERAQRTVRCTWSKKFRLRLKISSKEYSEQFADLRNQKSQLKEVFVSKKH